MIAKRGERMDDHDEKYRLLIGARIKALRQAKGWTAEEAGKRAGISRSRWLNWECGSRAPRIYVFPLLAKALGTSASYLAGFTDNPEGNPSNSEYVTANNPKIEANKEKSSTCQFVSDSIAFRASDLKQRHIESHNIILLKVSDNSMHPDLSKDDDVLISLAESEIKEPDIYAIRENDGNIWFRWIRKEIGGSYTLYANDKTHSQDQVISESEFKNLNILGRYVWSGRWRN